MKRVLLVVLATMLMGCKIDADLYDRAATVKQLQSECKRFGGELNTYRYGTAVRGRSWSGDCIHIASGAKFEVYVPGVLE